VAVGEEPCRRLSGRWGRFFRGAIPTKQHIAALNPEAIVKIIGVTAA
jgi:hypothetical protein